MNMREKSGSVTLLVGIVLVATLAGVGGLLWWLPQRARQRRAENERSASIVIKTLASANVDFRANDRDGNGVNDFWTGDVAGLYKFGLIPRELAEADTEPLVPLVPKPVPYMGHFFRALDADDSDPDGGPYRQETDKKSGKVHHPTKFGFVVFPAEPGVSGKYMWIISEGNWAPRATLNIPVPRTWPADNALKAGWAKAQ